MTRIIAEIKNKADAAAIYRVLKKFNANTKMMTEKQWEDYVLGKMAAESEAEGSTVSRAEISKWFRQYGIDF
jgi:hypothetical protein